jgi:hypothetical protein
VLLIGLENYMLIDNEVFVYFSVSLPHACEPKSLFELYAEAM